MVQLKQFLLFSFFLILSTNYVLSKIILPSKLRYLENMLNSEVAAKAAKIRERLETNNMQDNENMNLKNWPLLLSKYNLEKTNKENSINNYKGYMRRNSYK